MGLGIDLSKDSQTLLQNRKDMRHKNEECSLDATNTCPPSRGGGGHHVYWRVRSCLNLHGSFVAYGHLQRKNNRGRCHDNRIRYACLKGLDLPQKIKQAAALL